MDNKFDLIFNNIPTKELFKNFIKRFVKVLPLVLLILIGFFYINYKARVDEEIIRQQVFIDYTAKSIENELVKVSNDIYYISTYEEMRVFSNSFDKDDLLDLNNRLISFAQDSKRYDQIRILDLLGNEVNRINLVGSSYEAVDSDQLQFKGDRYYFKESIDLDEGDIYVSPFDLNTENGQVEMPYKPMIRFAMPLFDKDNNRIGVLILNYLGDQILDKIKNNLNDDKACMHLINQNGEFLYHSEEDFAWKFMFGEEKTIQQEASNVYDAIQVGSKEVVEDNNILHVYQSTISEDFTFSDQMNEGSLNNISWYLISGISQSVFDYLDLMMVLSVIFITLLVLAAIMWFRNRRLIQDDLIKTLLNILYNGIERSPAVFVLTNIDGEIVYVNQKFEEVTKYSLSEVIGENPRILKSDELSSKEYKDMWETITKGEIWEGQFHNKTKEDKYYWANAQISAIYENDKIAYFLAVQEDITELKELQSRLEQVAKVDELTNVYNKRYLTEVMEESRINKNLLGDVFSMLMIDIDYFKNINDQYGHPVGDEILKELTFQIGQLLRSNDIQFRYGGEEFLIILPEADLAAANRVAERIRATIEEHVFVTLAGDLGITISIGCTENIEDISIDEVIIRADKALYKAKENGRNRIENYE